MSDVLAHRLRNSLSILIKGDEEPRACMRFPSLIPEEMAQICAFFPMQKFFILGRASSGATLLAHPQAQMQQVWDLVGAGQDPALAGSVEAKMGVNPDEEWQGGKDASIASFLPKAKAGNWHSLFTEKDRSLIRSIAGAMLLQ